MAVIKICFGKAKLTPLYVGSERFAWSQTFEKYINVIRALLFWKIKK
jgi:hypothetical protein